MIDPWFNECLSKHVRFRSECGQFDLVVGIPKHCSEWRMPEKSEEQKIRAQRLWSEISNATLLETLTLTHR